MNSQNSLVLKVSGIYLEAVPENLLETICLLVAWMRHLSEYLCYKLIQKCMKECTIYAMKDYGHYIEYSVKEEKKKLIICEVTPFSYISVRAIIHFPSGAAAIFHVIAKCRKYEPLRSSSVLLPKKKIKLLAI